MTRSTLQSDKAEDAFIREIESSLREESSLSPLAETSEAPEALPSLPLRFVLYYLRELIRGQTP